PAKQLHRASQQPTPVRRHLGSVLLVTHRGVARHSRPAHGQQSPALDLRVRAAVCRRRLMPQLLLSLDEHAALWAHLLQDTGEEEAAFVFATTNGALPPPPIILVPLNAFVYKSAFRFGLSDEFRGAIVKEAHDRNAIIIE